MSKMLAIERETIILFNEGEAEADIETHNAAMKRRLETIRRTHPEDITLVKRGGNTDSYTFPKHWIKIIPPRKATDKQREHLKRARGNIKQ